MKQIKRNIAKLSLLLALISVLVVNIDAEAANYGRGYDFSLAPQGNSVDVSEAVEKNTDYAYAILYVNTYNSSYYYTRAYVASSKVTGRSQECHFCTTSSFNIYYNEAGSYRKGKPHCLYMITAADNPLPTTVTGSWTP